MTENKNVFGILGHPLGHTLSPQIHTRLFEISGEQAIERNCNYEITGIEGYARPAAR